MPLPANQVSLDLGMQTAAEPLYPNGTLYAGMFTLVFRIRRKGDKRLLKEHRLINMPVRISITTEIRTALYYTKAGPVADTPRAGGVGMTYFTITGHTGIAGVRQRGRVEAAPSPTILGPPLSPQSSLVDGAAAIKDLQDIIFLYFFPKGKPRPLQGVAHPQDVQLEFFHMTAPTSAQDTTGRVGWIIHPHRSMVDIQQEAPKPFLYTYTLTFACLDTTTKAVPDLFVQNFSDRQQGLAKTQEELAAAAATLPVNPKVFPWISLPTPLTALQQARATIQAATAQLNTIRATAYKMLGPQSTLPVIQFIQQVRGLNSAVRDFVGSVAATIRFPLYAQQSLGLQDIFTTPQYSVTTLKAAAQDLAHGFTVASWAQSLGIPGASTDLTAGVNDQLTLGLNGEPPVTLTLGTQTSGAAIAQTIQSQVQALTPAQPSNASAYRDFTCTFDPAVGQYSLVSGTRHSDSARVEVVVNPDTALTPGDASQALGLGLLNGGQEQAGSAAANTAMALLRGVEDACTNLLAFPDYFADQLEQQDARLAALVPTRVNRPQIHGDQRLEQTRITPGDTLQGIAARVNVEWQTLALVNRLTYPYILQEPTTLARGRTSSADYWTLTDVIQHWQVDAWQGQRLDIVAGPGAGQSRRILHNTATQLVLEHAWALPPNDTSDYAIRAADNPVSWTGTVTSATTNTVTNGLRTVVPESQMGYTMVLASGPAAGERRRVVQNDATTYNLDRPWTVVPPAGTIYILLGPGVTVVRQKIVGDLLSVPQPSAETTLPIRSRLQDVSAITGQQISLEEKLFGRDLLLVDGSLQYNAAQGDAVTIAGLPNLRQALINYINLPLAELEYAPHIGSYVQEELGLMATLSLQIQVLASVERTIKQDPRIATMDNASLATQGGQTLITFGATAINGSTVDRIVVR